MNAAIAAFIHGLMYYLHALQVLHGENVFLCVLSALCGKYPRFPSARLCVELRETLRLNVFIVPRF